MNWSSGYVTDVEYVPGFYREQSPSIIDLACLIQGYEPPASNGRFVYCDLGCGQGANALLIAAANPDATVIGVDFHPAQIARARGLADAAGLTNVTFIEAGFEDIAADRSLLPECDYITLHGIYSWVSSDIKGAIVRILATRLRPGGAVYVSYNALPAWSQAEPLQRLLSELAAGSDKPSTQAVAEAIEKLELLAKLGGPGFANQEMLTRLRQEIDKGNLAYLAHEYLNAHWRPLYHADVARDFEAAKLSFAGDAALLHNFRDLYLESDKKAALDAIDAPALRETARDFLTLRPFRRDVFLRGARKIDERRRKTLWENVGLALTQPLGRMRREIEVGVGKANLSDAYGVLFEALDAKPLLMGELLALPEISNRPDMSPSEIAGILVGSGQANPVRPHMLACDPSPALRYNMAALEDSRFGPRLARKPLAAPRAGTGLHVDFFPLAALREWMDDPGLAGDALAAAAAARAKACGEGVLEGGKAVTEEEALRAIFAGEFKHCAAWRQVFRNLGLLSP